MKEKFKKNIERAFEEKIIELDDLNNKGKINSKELSKQKKYAQSAKKFLSEHQNLISQFNRETLTRYDLDKTRYNLYFDFIKDFYPKLEEHFKNNP